MKTILSTKKLSIAQKERLLNARLAVVDFDFINTETIPFKIPKQIIENAIFTSQNGVNAVFTNKTRIKNCFCVGKRTEKLLKSKKQHIVYVGANAKELGNYITKEGNNTKTYNYFCAKKRLDTLPNMLNKHNINWHEIPVYKTLHTPKKYEQKFNGALFFSPSGVESYFSINKAPVHSFCIGSTTAKTLHKYTQNYTIATKPSIENVLVKTIKHFNYHD